MPKSPTLLSLRLIKGLIPHYIYIISSTREKKWDITVFAKYKKASLQASTFGYKLKQIGRWWNLALALNSSFELHTRKLFESVTVTVLAATMS